MLTAGKGSADLTWDPSTRVVSWDITHSGLTGPVTMAHFHNGSEGKNGPVVIWLTKKNTEAMGAIKGKATLTLNRNNSSRPTTGTSTCIPRSIPRANSADR